MDIIKLWSAAIFLVELTPLQLSHMGYGWILVSTFSSGIYLARLYLEVLVIWLGMNGSEWLFKKVIGFFKRFISWRWSIKKMSPKVYHRRHSWYLWRLIRYLWEEIANKAAKLKDKLMERLKTMNYWGLLLASIIPFVPTSVSAILYNTKQHSHPWYKINNLSFIALTGGSIIRILIITWFTI